MTHYEICHIKDLECFQLLKVFLVFKTQGSDEVEASLCHVLSQRESSPPFLSLRVSLLTWRHKNLDCLPLSLESWLFRLPSLGAHFEEWSVRGHSS